MGSFRLEEIEGLEGIEGLARWMVKKKKMIGSDGE